MTIHLFILFHIITEKGKSAEPPAEEGDEPVQQQQSPEEAPPAPEEVRQCRKDVI